MNATDKEVVLDLAAHVGDRCKAAVTDGFQLIDDPTLRAMVALHAAGVVLACASGSFAAAARMHGQEVSQREMTESALSLLRDMLLKTPSELVASIYGSHTP